jgi:hypothetical protein
VITRWRVDPEDCAALNSFTNIKVTVLVTHSGITHPSIEPVDSRIAAASLRTLFEHADRYRVVLYWRPIVAGVNDTPGHIEQALTLGRSAHATVFTGLFYKQQIRDYYQSHGLPEPYTDTARRKIFPAELERRILSTARTFDSDAGTARLFRKTSCAVSYVHGMADYNGHYGIQELCNICPRSQVTRCARAWTRPEGERTALIVEELGGVLLTINDRALVVSGLDEQHRYRVQHSVGYQVHDVTKQHHRDRHGRAEIGWSDAGRIP